MSMAWTIMQMLLPTMLGQQTSGRQRARVEENLAPAAEGVKQAVSQNQNVLNTDPGAYSNWNAQGGQQAPTGWWDAMTDAGLATEGRQGDYSWWNPLAQGGEAQGSMGELMMGDAMRKYQTELDFQGMLEGYMSQFGADVEDAKVRQQASIDDATEQRGAGLQDFQDKFQMAMVQNAAAQQAAKDNTQQVIDYTTSMLDTFTARSEEMFSNLESWKAEGLLESQNQTASLLEDQRRTFDVQRKAQHAQIDMMPNIPEAAKLSLKDRADFTSGIQMGSHAAKVWGEEALRLDAIRKDYTAIQADSMTRMDQAFGSLQGVAMGAVTTAVGNETAARQALAVEAGKIGLGFATEANAFREEMTGGISALSTQLNVLALQGRTDLFNMAASVPQAYLDLGSVYGDLIGLAYQFNDKDIADATTSFNVDAQMMGVDISSALPFEMAGFGSTLSNVAGAKKSSGGGGGQSSASEVAGYVSTGATVATVLMSIPW